MDNEADFLMMMAKLQGSTVKSAPGQQCLWRNGLEFPEAILRQSVESLV